MPSSSSVRSSTEHCVSAPAAATWPPTRRQRVRRRVAEHGHRRLELPEAECHSRRRVRRDQERVVDAVRDVSLDRRRPSHPHLLHRLEDLDRCEKRQRRGDLRGRHPRDEPCDLRRGHRGVDDHPRQLDRVERHRLLGDGHVDPVARDELVDQVELRLRLAVELHHPPLLDPKLGSGSKGLENATRPSAGSSGTRVSRLIGLVA